MAWGPSAWEGRAPVPDALLRQDAVVWEEKEEIGFQDKAPFRTTFNSSAPNTFPPPHVCLLPVSAGFHTGAIMADIPHRNRA